MIPCANPDFLIQGRNCPPDCAGQEIAGMRADRMRSLGQDPRTVQPSDRIANPQLKCIQENSRNRRKF